MTGSKQQIAFFCDTWTNCFTPQVGIAAVRVLEAIGYEVLVPQTVCCGRPAISKGLLDEAQRLSEKNAAILADIAERDVPIVGVEPSCILTLVDEFPELVRSDVSRHIAKCAMTIESFLAQEPNFSNMKRLVRPHRGTPVLYHAHCHQKTLVGSQDAMKLLTVVAEANEINSSCCGMAGAFGHEVEHQEVARLVGEKRLFPAIRARPDASVAVSGFSCRHQIAHYTAARPRHVIEHLAEALP